MSHSEVSKHESEIQTLDHSKCSVSNSFFAPNSWLLMMSSRADGDNFVILNKHL